jgi:hypothetical protein
VSARIDAQAFADRWISDWNSKDVEAVVGRFSENVVFTSPRAKRLWVQPGSKENPGLGVLDQGHSSIQAIRFTLDYVISNKDRMSVVYIAEIDGKRMRAVEFFVFGEDGLVREGEAMHGIDL